MIISGTNLVNVGFVNDVQPIVSGAALNLDPATGISGSTWTNTGTLGSSLNYTLLNSPSTVSVNNTTALSFPGGAVESPGSMTKPYAFNATGFTAMGSSSQAFTLDIWACPQSSTAGCLIKEYGQSSGGVPSGGWEDAWINFLSGNINASVWNGSAGTSTVATYTAGRWYHIVMTYNGSNQLLIYVNGNLASTQNFGRSAQGANCMLTVAGCERYNYLGGSGGNPYFNGYVGPFKMYYSSLTAAQVTQNFNALRWRYSV
jgi:hypothetical protein